MNEQSRCMGRNHQGFTLIELMVVVAIVGILAAVAIPNYMSWRPKHALNRAVNEYNNLLQQARMTAIKNHAECKITFSNTGYKIDCTSLKRDIVLAEYGSGVKFSNPSGGLNKPNGELIFTSKGYLKDDPAITAQPYLYFSNHELKQYYRVGPLISGVIRRDSWNGNTWVGL